METWKPITEAPDYAVSSMGRIKRITKGTKAKIGRILKPWRNRFGYSLISLRTNGVIKAVVIHRAVMREFVGPSTLHVNHKNGDKSDNRLDNLEYVTPNENRIHAMTVLDAFPKGSKHPNSKLTEPDVRRIFTLIDQGMSDRQIAAVIGCTGANIWHIRKGKAWKHLSEQPRPPNFKGRRVL